MTVEILIQSVSTKLASGTTLDMLIGNRAKAETKLTDVRGSLKKAQDEEQSIAAQLALVAERKASLEGKIRILRPTLLATLTDLAAVAEPVKGSLLKANEPRRLLQEELNLLQESADFLENVKVLPARMRTTMRAVIEANASEAWMTSAAEVEAAELLEKLGSVLKECDPSLKLSVQASGRLTDYCRLANEYGENARQLEARLNVERTQAFRAQSKFLGPLPVPDEIENVLEETIWTD